VRKEKWGEDKDHEFGKIRPFLKKKRKERKGCANRNPKGAGAVGRKKKGRREKEKTNLKERLLFQYTSKGGSLASWHEGRRGGGKKIAYGFEG